MVLNLITPQQRLASSSFPFPWSSPILSSAMVSALLHIPHSSAIFGYSESAVALKQRGPEGGSRGGARCLMGRHLASRLSQVHCASPPGPVLPARPHGLHPSGSGHLGGLVPGAQRKAGAIGECPLPPLLVALGSLLLGYP